MRDAEVVVGRCGKWTGVGTQGASVATHVDRIFGVLVEERRECTCCKAVGRSFERQFVYDLEAVGGVGDALVTDMYLRSCVPCEGVRVCQSGACRGRETTHCLQRRMVNLPNVLLLEVRRDGDSRGVVSVEEQTRVLLLLLQEAHR